MNPDLCGLHPDRFRHPSPALILLSFQSPEVHRRHRQRPISDGFEENVEFLHLEYLDRDEVSLGRSFEAVSSLLWLKAGGIGPRIEKIVKPWALPDGSAYGVLFDPQHWGAFVRAVQERVDAVGHVFVVTDSTSVFQQVLAELPAGIEATMLYEDYLSTFTINTGGRT